MSAARPSLAVALVLALPLTAAAWGHHRPRSTSAYYSYPVAVVVAPAVGVVYPQPAPVTAVPVPAVGLPAPVYAVPAPAPAYPTPLPAAPVPGVNESRSNYAGAVRVSFWNHSNQDLTLRIDGESRILARGRGLTMELPRQFVWQIGGREAEVERVPASEAGVEILIRR